ncbi:hypothetical protein M378DRAFT_72099 [Amanita muscaria Koide BX008]|uniref:Uncharacterized protein n=1 Tax=Amanita muscaria (strain Koide BX008) TaxID=946122 RepID=A0A0C2XFP8_AMAMK|nr:hypothetical protein M378DRAFT_72099 [Amanita muscaria Koide BX008]
MPVPVPRISKPPAHPVIKKNNNSGNLQANSFQNLTRTLPVSPTGPPPSYGTREEWIESLPSWRRQKPRRIWEEDNTIKPKQPAVQGFTHGLTTADNAPVIKGERAQACIPPLYDLLKPIAAEDEMHFDLTQLNWEPCNGPDYLTEGLAHDFSAPNPFPTSIDVSIPDAHTYERSAFSPILEEESPGLADGINVASSPLGPLTPFCDFVDRVVSEPQPAAQTCCTGSGNTMFSHASNMHGLRSLQHGIRVPVIEQPKQLAPGQVPEAKPNSATAYKKLAEPLAEWMAHYVWKVCTTGYNLPSGYVNSASIPIARFLDSPPRNLAPSIHAILLSTLLQPSAVFLALWYIVRLPVYGGSIPLSHGHAKEVRFRTALFGEPRTSTPANDSILNLSHMDESVPFRLVLLGCMLANKWLDDHTFSNKTWHSISNVPIHMLNELEMLTLDLFSYDLSVSSEKWTLWMDHIRSHHLSSIPPSHIQPISRPSSNPHLIICNTIEDIFHAKISTPTSVVPQPVFLGLDQRKKEQLEREQTVDDIDLDEDGPLREEYLPRRRSNGSGVYQDNKIGLSGVSMQQVSEHVLPPPAKWSPAGDEPILRDRNRTSGNYVAVQAAGVTSVPTWSAFYPHLYGGSFHDQAWTLHSSFASTGYEVANHHPDPYSLYAYAPPVLGTHMRTHSLSHDGNSSQLRGHMRSFSQTCSDYKSSDIQVASLETFSGKELSNSWYATTHYSYAPPAYAYHPGVVHQPAWVRT